jgi:hypothetical protein
MNVKRLILVLILLITFSLSFNAQDSKPFLGDWEVKLVEQNEDAFPWSQEIKYPVRFSITEENGKLKGTYTDQYDYSSEFSVLFVKDNEIFFIHGGWKKHRSSLSPMHRAILKNGGLSGYVFTGKKLFEWTAIRKQQISSKEQD